MRLFKLLTTSLMLGLIGLFFYENATVFQTSVPFNLDLYIREQVNWTHPLYVVLLLAVFVGFLAGIGVMLRPYLRMRRMLGHERQEKESASTVTRVPALPPSAEGTVETVEAEVVESDPKRQEPTPKQ
ncbi:MAG: hypothetical protein AB9873_15025 [Syntrophobacteraceae bacterium]